MKKSITIGIFSIFISGLAHAGVNNKIEHESYSHNERIKILEKADICIKNAKTKDDFKQCEKAEKNSRKELRKSLFESRKKQMIEKMETRKNCVTNASSPDDLKNCRPKKRVTVN